jgi:uncharacterized protein (TIGR03083 family)
VLSHLGSGAEITLAGLKAAVAGSEAPVPEFNQSVWARWNALSPQDQAAGFLQHNAELVEAYEALSQQQRETLPVKLGFLPSPLSLAGALGMRLNEATMHAWDVHAGLDPASALDATAAQLLLEHYSGEMSFMLGLIGKADQLDRGVVVDLDGYGLVIADAVSLGTSATGATATFNGPAEAAVRLIGGRLTPRFTPDGITVTGNVTLDELRPVFPGF